MVWQIRFNERAKKDLGALDKPVAKRITRFLQERLAASDNPRSFGAALKGAELGDFWRYRVGDHRVIAFIEDSTITILVLQIGHRREVYR